MNYELDALRRELETTLRGIEELREQLSLPLARREPIQRQIQMLVAWYEALMDEYGELEERDRERRRAEEFGLAGLREAYASDKIELEEFERLLPYVLEKPQPKWESRQGDSSPSRFDLIFGIAIVCIWLVLVVLGLCAALGIR